MIMLLTTITNAWANEIYTMDTRSLASNQESMRKLLKEMNIDYFKNAVASRLAGNPFDLHNTLDGTGLLRELVEEFNETPYTIYIQGNNHKRADDAYLEASRKLQLHRNVIVFWFLEDEKNGINYMGFAVAPNEEFKIAARNYELLDFKFGKYRHFVSFTEDRELHQITVNAIDLRTNVSREFYDDVLSNIIYTMKNRFVNYKLVLHITTEQEDDLSTQFPKYSRNRLNSEYFIDEDGARLVEALRSYALSSISA